MSWMYANWNIPLWDITLTVKHLRRGMNDDERVREWEIRTFKWWRHNKLQGRHATNGLRWQHEGLKEWKQWNYNLTLRKSGDLTNAYSSILTVKVSSYTNTSLFARQWQPISHWFIDVYEDFDIIFFITCYLVLFSWLC